MTANRDNKPKLASNGRFVQYSGMNRRASLSVSGRVQGVCFRMSAVDEAERLGLTGWVRNTRDGGVEIAAEGPEDALSAFVDWCRTGPPLARVDGVRVEWTDATGEFDAFETRY